MFTDNTNNIMIGHTDGDVEMLGTIHINGGYDDASNKGVTIETTGNIKSKQSITLDGNITCEDDASRSIFASVTSTITIGGSGSTVRTSSLSVDQNMTFGVAEDFSKVIPKKSKILISASSYCYLDMKYDSLTPLGLNWAGYLPVKKAYDWDPRSLVSDLDSEQILKQI